MKLLLFVLGIAVMQSGLALKLAPTSGLNSRLSTRGSAQPVPRGAGSSFGLGTRFSLSNDNDNDDDDDEVDDEDAALGSDHSADENVGGMGFGSAMSSMMNMMRARGGAGGERAVGGKGGRRANGDEDHANTGVDEYTDNDEDEDELNMGMGRLLSLLGNGNSIFNSIYGADDDTGTRTAGTPKTKCKHSPKAAAAGTTTAAAAAGVTSTTAAAAAAASSTTAAASSPAVAPVVA